MNSMPHSVGRALLISLLAFHLACSGEDPSAGEDPGLANGDPLPFSEAEYEEGLTLYERASDHQLQAVLDAEAFCYAIWECLNVNHVGLSAARSARGGTSSKQECIARMTETSLSSDADPQLQASFASGRVIVDRDQLPECRADFLINYCESGLINNVLFSHPCHDVIRGQVEQGEACTGIHECADDLSCEVNLDWDDYENTCQGVCMPQEVVADNCGDRPCRVDEYCDMSDPGSIQCSPRGDDGDSCDGTHECLRRYVCSTEGTCTPFDVRPKGESCDWSETVVCEAGTTCLVEDPDAVPATGECGIPGDQGAPCSGISHCHTPYLCHGAQDGTEGTCRLSNAGETCSLGDNCAEGDCLPVGPGSVCTLPAANGEPCTFFAECESQFCDQSTGACAPFQLCEI